MIRESVRAVLQELIELEATETIGAARYERSEERVTDRNGHRPKLLTTKAGDVQLHIPKLRKGTFYPGFLEPRRRIDTQDRPGPVLGGDGGLRPRGQHPRRRRPRRRPRRRHRHQQVRGLPDLRAAG
ncbi:transposase [Aquipuribacter nitratireducens]|uniref:Mutator family transposase n=2 Tax=Aquipuribacter nitratireducens TaxID=650104 RepID=A0ABW0GQJ0_9MICO